MTTMRKWLVMGVTARLRWGDYGDGGGVYAGNQNNGCGGWW